MVTQTSAGNAYHQTGRLFCFIVLFVKWCFFAAAKLNATAAIAAYTSRRPEHNADKTMAKLRSWQLRGQLHLLTGFITGFVCAFMLLLFIYDVHNGISCWPTSSSSSGSSDYTSSSAMNRFSADLSPAIRVLCMVLTCPDYVERYAQHVYATWGQRCNKLIFVSSENYEPLGVVQVVDSDGGNYEDLWNKTREGFRYVWLEYGAQYDWFLKADDDTWVQLEMSVCRLCRHEKYVC